MTTYKTTPSIAGDSPHPRIIVIGGGAAGYFAAITAAESNPNATVTIYEASKRTLSKVKISGGGRCNVTHNCFDPKELATRYPRGSRELRGAFHRWQPQDTLQWFAERGVRIKAEADGRMFPTTDDSQTIIDCFHQAAQSAGVKLRKECAVKNIGQQLSAINNQPSFILHLSDDSQVSADKVLIATGSLKASPLTRSLEALGHSIAPLAPSLFAFNLADKRTHGLAGLAVQNARVTYAPNVGASLVKTAEPKGSSRKSKPTPQTGPILITHRGLSGPAILRLSAWQARTLQEKNYHFEIEINWLGDMTENQVREQFKRLRKGKTQVKTKIFEQIPRRFWERMVEVVGIADDQKWAQLSKDKESALINELVNGRYKVQGKTTNKLKVNPSLVAKGMKETVPAEFVTAGGISRNEIDFRTMESKIVPNLYFAGECIDIDGITGGFNFQACWTGGHIAGLAMAAD
ncbi:NAD(P)/FAD-dependent oxidoreductase [Coraliomargarita sp. SDUM461004]|uniref:NAD(P)/FAD-dependent oxidoreductase n=1 Tax=Thalassobacterium sedimentorum TaxID=3041258 RepID=A0ABU1AGK2_9BACT|nr:NAD(P)/FAD-dependent oxidoreductase [Coraliomargarita sp. SDUM461004]MDQ8193859.1 NAD(P)/FAD-dependent oxidoreductase [Coraliomargarita sp. SDUM461004]